MACDVGSPLRLRHRQRQGLGFRCTLTSASVSLVAITLLVLFATIVAFVAVVAHDTKSRSPLSAFSILAGSQRGGRQRRRSDRDIIARRGKRTNSWTEKTWKKLQHLDYKQPQMVSPDSVVRELNGGEHEMAGRRLARFRRLVEAMKEAFDLQEDYEANPRHPFKWMNRRAKWRKILEDDRRKGLGLEKQARVMQEIAEWMPVALGMSGPFRQPLDPQELAELFLAFRPESSENYRQMLEGVLNRALVLADLKTSTALLEGMALAGLPHPPVWQMIGHRAMDQVHGAEPGDVIGLTWALSTAEDGLEQEEIDALKKGLKVGLSSNPGLDLGVFAWGCAEVQLNFMHELVGYVPINAPSEAARSVWSAMSRLAATSGAQSLSLHPLPVVELPEAISSEHAEQLVRLADRGNLWQPSAKSADGPLPGRPWSVLFAGPVHREHPAIIAVRRWVAKTLDVPIDHVEGVRVVRYRPGEQSAGANADARPERDPTLWLSGQRLATVLIGLTAASPGYGGETVFPDVHPVDGSEDGLKVALKARTALIWPTVDVAGEPEPRAARAALPVHDVGDGFVKYTLTTWVRSRRAPDECGVDGV